MTILRLDGGVGWTGPGRETTAIVAVRAVHGARSRVLGEPHGSVGQRGRRGLEIRALEMI